MPRRAISRPSLTCDRAVANPVNTRPLGFQSSNLNLTSSVRSDGIVCVGSAEGEDCQVATGMACQETVRSVVLGQAFGFEALRIGKSDGAQNGSELIWIQSEVGH